MFLCSNLTISDDMDEDCEEEDEIGMDEESESWSGQWSSFTDASAMTPQSEVSAMTPRSEVTVMSPMSADLMQMPFSPEVNSPPVSQQQQQFSTNMPNPILTGLLTKQPLDGASGNIQYAYSSDILNGNGLTESDASFPNGPFPDLPMAPFELDQNADKFSPTSTIRDLDENNIYQVSSTFHAALENDQPLFTPPIMEDSDILEWSQLNPSFDPRENSAKV